MRQPDALRRGIVVHDIFEAFITCVRDDPSQLTSAHLMQVADRLLAHAVPWPEIRLLWQAKLARVADWFIATEQARQTVAPPGKLEAKARAQIPELGFTLTAQADRIDIDTQGRAYIYDYKTGTPPTKPQQAHFDKQLLLEAAMLTEGAFEQLAPMHVQSATFIGLGSSPSLVAAPLDEHPPQQVWQEFIQLVTRYLTPEQGFTARRALFKETDIGDYDQLARFGEWDTTTPPSPEDLT
jgi:RecB family exonuclease